MRNKMILRIVTLCMAAIIASTSVPMNAYAATSLKVGSRGSDVVQVQSTLQKLGYFTYPVATGYYGSYTKEAVKNFQKDNGITANGTIGKTTMQLLLPDFTSTSDATIRLASVKEAPYRGDLDWFTEVRDIWKRGMDAVVTDVDTGKSFQVTRTYGTNHADVETLTKEDTETMKEIWGGYSWERRAVVVEVAGYTLAGSMTAMPHAGLENKPEGNWVYGRSAGFGFGYNYDAIKDNGISGHMDIHFKNSKTHGTGVVQKVHQDMVKKAAEYIARLNIQT
jgi:peptidoglycan hydrolase-like protein with peptidoglycan-binding domain